MDSLVHSIQALVDSIRSNKDVSTVKADMHEMISIFATVVDETQHTSGSSADQALLGQIRPMEQTFAGLNRRLLDSIAEGESIHDAGRWKEFTKRIPPMAFEVARETKELVSRLDALALGAEDDFR